MIESSLPHASHKAAPSRAPVICGNRSSGVQPISVNRVFVSRRGLIYSSLILVCHTERLPQSPCVRGEKHNISLKTVHQAGFETARQAATSAERHGLTIVTYPSNRNRPIKNITFWRLGLYICPKSDVNALKK